MPDETSHYVEAYEHIEKMFRKPARNWWWLANLAVALVGLVAAVATQIWWLLFIPVLAAAESAGVYIGAICTEVVDAKDAEIERLRRELGATC